MPSVWDAVLSEFNNAAAIPRPPGTKVSWVELLESRVRNLTDLTGTPLIIYASACTAHPGKVQPELLQIDASDKTSFHSILEDINGPKVDVLIHSGGGSAEATESIVEEMRRKFQFVRFIVPSYAKSAATIMAMSGDEILIDEDAELGPIDPQMFTRNGVVPGDAIKQQFKKASDEILADPRLAQVWFPVLQALGGGILAQCDNASDLAKNLVVDWLTKYMFRATQDGPAKAQAVADYLCFLAVSRGLKRRPLASAGGATQLMAFLCSAERGRFFVPA